MRKSILGIITVSAMTICTASWAQSSDAVLGNWINADPGSRGLVGFTIKDDGRLSVRAFGVCSPRPCDWGPVEGTVFSRSVGDPEGSSFSASWDFGFADATISAVLLPNVPFRCPLLATTFFTFKDGSGRSDFYFSERFCPSDEAPADHPSADPVLSRLPAAAPACDSVSGTGYGPAGTLECGTAAQIIGAP